MRLSFHRIWGVARGPAGRLRPQTRILVGLLALVGIVVADVDSPRGVLLVAALVAAWLAACRPPLALVATWTAYGLLLFGPLFLLAFVPREAGHDAATGWAGALVVPWRLFARGLAITWISLTTVSSLSVSDLREGLVRLPVPAMVRAILLQIVHQATLLTAETNRIAEAMAVRGASGTGRASLRVLASLPRVWLPRVLGRAERVAAAMELRGHGVEALTTEAEGAMRRVDGAALVAAVAVVVAAIALRLAEGP